METETIILIITNIVVPIVVAIITNGLQAKRYKKEIELLNIAHENHIKELSNEYTHQIEMLELRHKHEQELESQKTGNAIIEMMTNKLSDEIIKQPATQQRISQNTTRAFLNKKKR